MCAICCGAANGCLWAGPTGGFWGGEIRAVDVAEGSAATRRAEEEQSIDRARTNFPNLNKWNRRMSDSLLHDRFPPWHRAEKSVAATKGYVGQLVAGARVVTHWQGE